MTFWEDRGWLPFINQAGETAPAFAILRITGVSTDGEFQISKPNTYGSQYLHAINGPHAVPDTKKGGCSLTWPAWIAYATADGTPAFGEEWGPINNDWELRKRSGGFQVVGLPTSGRVLAVQSALLSGLGQADAQIAAGSAGTVSVYYWSSLTWTDTTENITARNTSGTTIAAAKKVAWEWHKKSNQFVCSPLEC